MKRKFNDKTKTLTVADANEHETKFLLRKNGEVINTTDPDGFVYENVYNNISQMIKFKYPDGLFELSDYDSFGRLVIITCRSGKKIKFEYNEKGKIVSL